MTGIDLEKSMNYNEPGRTLRESSFVEIVALRSVIEYVTEMSKRFPLLKCKHPGSVLRELQRG
ncbi:hypothetical protein T11_11402 [Trichinella zimbabwensis]|uniref:Uncharacterized protein n=1 Tax=Trichinella zimbabwensis TaxID=268475 RepID=A0A0V1GPG9_9BILA|nr:hypothetical protein T11_11402 [Trichinella zimbabwensis]